eukprot:scaffold1117_cov167-Amphora_coffeaeformis.AAC.4
MSSGVESVSVSPHHVSARRGWSVKETDDTPTIPTPTDSLTTKKGVMIRFSERERLSTRKDRRSTSVSVLTIRHVATA